MSEFLAMGGYAAYVWPSYGIALVVLGGFTLQAVLRYRAAQRELSTLEIARREARS
jgi:heme exporter protein D